MKTQSIKINLSKLSPKLHEHCKNREDAEEMTCAFEQKIYDLLYLMFAHDQYSLLIILQGIDTSGKDGVVRRIFKSCNPQGIRVHSFKKPSREEFRHDFLWRCHVKTPESGLATVFNRSYYEEVTTAMVHPELLVEQHIPSEILEHPDFFKKRYQCINDFEELLVKKGTVVIKFFLHISKEEQKSRILDRLQNPKKNWKFSKEDVKERKFWNHYKVAFQKMINNTNTKCAPWTVIPSDDKWYRDFMVSKTIVERLLELKMKFPKTKDKKISFR